MSETTPLYIKLPSADWLASIDAAASAKGMNRSEWVRWAMSAKLPADVRRELPKTKTRGRQKTA